MLSDVLTVPNHDGSDRRDGEGFFGPPPPSEIGELLSASTDKTPRLRSRRFAQRAVLFFMLASLFGVLGFLAGGAIGAALEWRCGVPDKVRRVIQATLIVTALGIVALEIWTKEVCTYVGSDGISRTIRIWHGLIVQTLRYSDVAWLRTSQTRLTMLGAPGHTTSFDFTWSDGMGKHRFRISGSYGGDTLFGNEAPAEPVWNPIHFAFAAERVWTKIKLARAKAALVEHGACEFPTCPGEAIVVKHDAIVIHRAGATTEIPMRQIKEVAVLDGLLEIESVSAKRGFVKDDGVFKRDICWIANFQVLYQMLALSMHQSSTRPPVELDRRD